MLIETHAHLDFPEFGDDLEDILARATAAGVEKIITIGTTLASSRAAIALAERYPQVWATVGIHPNHAAESTSQDLEEIDQLCRHPRVVAVGEAGLDYHYLPSRTRSKKGDVTGALLAQTTAKVEEFTHDGAEIAAQKAVFEAQLDMAVRHGLNVVIHQRDSFEDTVDQLRPYSGRLKGVFHCFGGSSEAAAALLELGHLVSFTGIVTFKNAGLVRETASRVPDGSFMVETDCPYLAPVPHRGGRCEPAYVQEVARTLATERGVTLDSLAAQTSKTAEEFFRFNR